MLQKPARVKSAGHMGCPCVVQSVACWRTNQVFCFCCSRFGYASFCWRIIKLCTSYKMKIIQAGFTRSNAFSWSAAGTCVCTHTLAVQHVQFANDSLFGSIQRVTFKSKRFSVLIVIQLWYLWATSSLACKYSRLSALQPLAAFGWERRTFRLYFWPFVTSH